MKYTVFRPFPLTFSRHVLDSKRLTDCYVSKAVQTTQYAPRKRPSGGALTDYRFGGDLPPKTNQIFGLWKNLAELKRSSSFWTIRDGRKDETSHQPIKTKSGSRNRMACPFRSRASLAAGIDITPLPKFEKVRIIFEYSAGWTKNKCWIVIGNLIALYLV